MAPAAISFHNSFCPHCLQRENRLVTGTKYCPHCREATIPLPAHFLAQLGVWLDHREEGRSPAASSGIPSAPGQPIRGRIRLAPSGKQGHAPRLELVVRAADGGRRLPHSQVPFPLLLGPRDAQIEVQARVGTGKNMPFYFLARVDKDGAPAKLSDELNGLGYSVEDHVEIEVLDGGTRFAIRPTGRPREQTQLLQAPDQRAVPKLKSRRNFQWTPEDLRERVAEYDGGSWLGNNNVELDKQAYRLFDRGLEVDDMRLVDMLAHVGTYYGGAYRPDGDVRTQAEQIAKACAAARKSLIDVLRRQRPLVERLPDVEDVVALMEPFKQEKMWFVWGAKFLHFLRPDVFPIIDRRIETALGHRQRISNSPGYLVAFCKLLRDVLIQNRDALEQVRRREPEHAEPSILKVLDKALWVLGGKDRS